MISLKSLRKKSNKKKNKLSQILRLKYLRNQKKKTIVALKLRLPLSRCSCFRYPCNNCKIYNSLITLKSMCLVLNICTGSVQMEQKTVCFITRNLTSNHQRLHLLESLLVSKISNNGALSLKSHPFHSTEKTNACRKNI